MNKYDLVDWDEFKKELEKQPGFKQALKETEVEFRVAYAVIKARTKKGFTQAELAKKLNTKQSVISRVETAKTTPTLSFLKRLAKAVDASLEIQFKF